MSENDLNEQQAEKGTAVSKRIKLSDPDLAVVCRSEKNKEETLHYHSVAMALHSSYFDNLLTSGMQESSTKTVTLGDVDPKEFRLAIEILENPLKATKTTAQECMNVASIYNRFAFSKGLELVESILCDYLDQWTKQKKKSPSPAQMKVIGDAILFSQEANLEKLIEKSQNFIKTKIVQEDCHGMGLFQESFIEKMKPFLEEHKEECVSDLYTRVFNVSAAKRDGIFKRPDFFNSLYWDIYSSLDAEILRSPKLQIDGKFRAEESNETTEKSIVLSPYELMRQTTTETNCGRLLGRKQNEEMGMFEHGEIGDWCIQIILSGEKYYTFVSPFSKTSSLPPLGTGWTLAAAYPQGITRAVSLELSNHHT